MNINIDKIRAKVRLDSANKWGMSIDGILVGILKHHSDYYNGVYAASIKSGKKCIFRSFDGRVYNFSTGEATDFINKYNDTIASLTEAAQ
jgi:hypothetical protein